MKQFSNLLKKLRLRQILTIFLVGVALFINTACNSGDVRGARPNNPPVQAGGANNPHKGGGDGYTQYKTSTDPRANTSSISSNHTTAALSSQQSIAASGGSDLLYPGSGTNNKKLPEIVPGSKKLLDEEAVRNTAQPQPIVDRSDPDAQILERVGEVFKDASAFIKDTADEAGERPEMQANPTRN